MLFIDIVISAIFIKGNFLQNSPINKKKVKPHPHIMLIRLNSLLVSPRNVRPKMGIPTCSNVAILKVICTAPKIRICLVFESETTKKKEICQIHQIDVKN